jgi:hypothetical protein
MIADDIEVVPKSNLRLYKKRDEMVSLFISYADFVLSLI